MEFTNIQNPDTRVSNDMTDAARGTDLLKDDAKSDSESLADSPTDGWVDTADLLDTTNIPPDLGTDLKPDLSDTDLQADILDTNPVEVETCTPSCGNSTCGDNGCGGLCGLCADNEYCGPIGLCILLCGDGVCGSDETCVGCPADCGACFCDTAECGLLEQCNEATDGCEAMWLDIPAGTFWMGCNDWQEVPFETSCHCSSYPYHHATLGPYQIQQTEVTLAQLLPFLDHLEAEGTPNLCMDDEGEAHPCLDTEGEPIFHDLDSGAWIVADEDEGLPVGTASWYGARSYCQWIGGRLCTNEEWEKAGRGGCEHYDDCRDESPRFPWGQEKNPDCGDPPLPSCPVVNWLLPLAAVGSHPGGQSAYGALDMMGNAWEWTDALEDEIATRRGREDYGMKSLSLIGERYASSTEVGNGIRCCRSLCGDGTCNATDNEDCETCPEDCGPCPQGSCGDAVCLGDETTCSCPQDCGDPCEDLECGPAPCLGAEIDCGACTGYQTCYAGICKVLDDCDAAAATDDICPDGICGVGESCESCPEDCGDCPQCGDVQCTAFEVCDPTLGVCLAEQVPIPADEFWMGCNEAVDTLCQEDEYPQHLVMVDAFLMDRTEVTFAQYKSFLEATQPDGPASTCCKDDGACYQCFEPTNVLFWINTEWYLEPGYSSHPMRAMTWLGARTYCQWAGRRMCTEDEFEMASRGGCGLYNDCKNEIRKYPWGNESPDCSLVVMKKILGQQCSWPYETTALPVGSRPRGASPYGIYDLSGNMNEPTGNLYTCDYSETSPCLSPSGDSYQIPIRGGSFSASAMALRSSFRGNIKQFYPLGESTGFRCCVDLVE